MKWRWIVIKWLIISHSSEGATLRLYVYSIEQFTWKFLRTSTVKAAKFIFSEKFICNEKSWRYSVDYLAKSRTKFRSRSSFWRFRMMICIRKRYFDTNRLILLPIGLWPDKQTKFARFRAGVLFSILSSCIVFQVIRVIADSNIIFCVTSLVYNITEGHHLIILYYL